MMIFLIIIHVIACVVLIGLVLIQRGRGSGLVESFQGVESMFGTKTNAFLTRTTTVLSVVFFFTCLALAVFSIRQSRSLMSNVKTPQTQAPAQQSAPAENSAVTQPQQAPAEAAPLTEAPKVEEKKEEAPQKSE